MQTKIQKQKILEELREMLSRQKALILIGITGLKVKDLTELRKKVKAIDGKLKIVKKTLAQIVLKENKLDFDKKQFKEEIGFVFGFKDEISPAKAVYQFGLTNDKLKILTGFLGGKSNPKKTILELALLPGREELLARLLGSISAPVSNFVYVLKANLKGLVYVLSAIKK